MLLAAYFLAMQDKRKQDLLTLESLRAKKAELEQELEKYKENDPEVLKALGMRKLRDSCSEKYTIAN